jgi:hypothetical protein
MITPLDLAMQQAGLAEQAVLTDQTNVGNIQDAIAASTSPLDAAQAQLAEDVQAFTLALQNVSAVALAAQLPVPAVAAVAVAAPSGKAA